MIFIYEQNYTLIAPSILGTLNGYLEVNQAEVKASPVWDPAATIVENNQHRLHKHFD